MKKIMILSLLAFVVSTTVSAQSMGTSYKTALGVKVWDGGGITFKTFVADNQALELIGYFWRDGSRVTGLYEFHYDINGVPGLKWYIGPGAHVGFYNGKSKSNPVNQSFAGVDGVLGLDLKINRAPINFSLDWQPSFEFGANRGFVGSWGGFAVRYTF